MSDPTTFLNKSEDEIRAEIFEIGTRETGLSNFKSTGVLRGIFETMTALISRIYIWFLSPILTQIDRRTASGFWLRVHGNNLGVPPLEATRTKGNASVKAYASGTLKAGSWVRVEGSDLRFRVTDEIAFLTGTFLAPIEAEATGSIYNVTPGTPVVLTKVTQGIASVHLDTDWITYSGTDEETDDAYRSRIDDRWSAQGEGNPPSKYELVARSVAGVTDAKVIRTPRGFGSIDVLIAGSAGLPTDTQLAAVRSELESLGMVCRDLIVRAPGAVSMPVDLEFAGDYTVAAVENAARNWIVSRRIGAGMEVRGLYTEPWDGFVFESLEVLEPHRDVVIADNEMIVPAITVTKIGGSGV